MNFYTNLGLMIGFVSIIVFMLSLSFYYITKSKLQRRSEIEDDNTTKPTTGHYARGTEYSRLSTPSSLPSKPIRPIGEDRDIIEQLKSIINRDDKSVQGNSQGSGQELQGIDLIKSKL